MAQVAPEHSWYQLYNSIDRAIADGRYRCLDWGSGIASEKLLLFNDSEPRIRLRAAGGPRSTIRSCRVRWRSR